MVKKPIETQTTNEDNNNEVQDESLVIDLTAIRKEQGEFGEGALDLDKAFESGKKTAEDKKEDEDDTDDADNGSKDGSNQKGDKEETDEEDQEDTEDKESDEDAEDEEGGDKKKKLTRSEKRIVELNEKKKAAEKQAREAEERAARLEAQLKSSQFSSSKRNYESSKSALESRVQLAEQEYIRAQNEGDTVAASKAISQMTAAQTQLVAIEAALESIKGSESEQTNSTKQNQQQQQTTQSDNGVDVAEAQKLAAKFLRKHPKVYSDDRYANMIKQMTNQVLAEGELAQDSPEYWEEVENLIAEVEEASAKKKESNSNKNTKTPVSGAGQGSSTARSKVENNPNIVTLTAREAQTARNLGLTYEEYAQEKANDSDFVILPKPANRR